MYMEIRRKVSGKFDCRIKHSNGQIFMSSLENYSRKVDVYGPAQRIGLKIVFVDLKKLKSKKNYLKITHKL